MPTDQTDYFRHREQQERALARSSADPAARAIHFELAARYAALAEDAGLDCPRPQLTLAIDNAG